MGYAFVGIEEQLLLNILSSGLCQEEVCAMIRWQAVALTLCFDPLL